MFGRNKSISGRILGSVAVVHLCIHAFSFGKAQYKTPPFNLSLQAHAQRFNMWRNPKHDRPAVLQVAKLQLENWCSGKKLCRLSFQRVAFECVC